MKFYATLIYVFIYFVFSLSELKAGNLNEKFGKVFSTKSTKTRTNQDLFDSKNPIENNSSSAFSCLMKIEEVKKINFNSSIYKPSVNRLLDTVYVGEVPNDTMVIVGSYEHTGPIFVFNDGVLIIHNSSFINEGDVYVFGNGKLLCDSSVLNFPQQYFYQRGIITVQHGLAYFKDMSFNYSGMQHNLIVGDSATVGFENVHQADWTTAGLYGKASLYIDGMNIGGEYILTDSSTAVYKNVDTLLLWHKFPMASQINHSFPQGDTVNNYFFSNVIPNVNGIDYTVFADSCHTVWWGVMPVNGSDVTINNSNIRAVGAWFTNGDSLNVNGIQNNTFYPNTTIPLTDRTLNLLNCFVQTWSFYVFDTSYVSIENCTLGEVGTQQTAKVLAQNMLLDGSGGYFWATDTSSVFAIGVTAYSTVRSEKNGIFLLAYSQMPFAGPTATKSSVMISLQNTTAFEPIAYDGAVVWNQKIDYPSLAHTDSIIPIVGSAWINQGPNGSFMDFYSYSVFYKPLNDSIWTALVIDSTSEVYHSNLANWNTFGLPSGIYQLRLLVKNDLGDSLDCMVNVNLVQGILTNLNNSTSEFDFIIMPNPSINNSVLNFELNKSENLTLIVSDEFGKSMEIFASKKYFQGKYSIDLDDFNLASGIYFVSIKSEHFSKTKKLVIYKY